MTVGDSVTLTLVTRAPAVNGTFVNEAEVVCNEPEWNSLNNYDNATVIISDVPDVGKTPDKNRTFRYENVTYYITVVNVGAAEYNETLTLVDDLPFGVEYIRTVSCSNATLLSTVLSNDNKTITWEITDIPQGATAVIEVLTVATEFGTQVNNVTINYPDGSNRSVNATVEVVGVDVAVVKSVDQLYHSVNDTVVWTIAVTNADNSTAVATGVVLNDTLPAGFVLISATPSRGTYNATSNVWSIGNMTVGDSVTLTLVTRAPAVNGTFVNEAEVVCNEPEWNSLNNYDNATVVISLLPPPEKLVNNTRPFYHENVTYYLTVENIGDADFVRNLTVIDSLPDGVDYIRTIDVTGAVLIDGPILSNNNKTITWVITNITAGDTAVIIVEAQANAVGVKVNNETVIYPDGSNATVNATIEVQPIVDVSVDKTVGKDVYFVGDVVVWTIKVANAFNGTIATDVTLNDVLPSEFTLINYTSTRGNYTGGVWYIGDMLNGTEETLIIYSRAVNANPNVTNYANVTCNETEWNYDNNYDNATVTVVLLPPPHKDVNNTRPFYHENVTYYLTVINDGDYIFDLNATVIDSLPDGVDYIRTIGVTGADLIEGPVLSNNNKTITWVITNIDPHSIAVIIVEAQANAVGVKVNNETVIYPDGSNATVNATIEVQPIVDVSVDKTVGKDVYFVGDVVVWTIKVANAFNGTIATDVNMDDILPSQFTLINYTATTGNYTNGIWTIGDMLNGTEETLTIYSRAVAAAENITNYAHVSCNVTEWNYDNNYDNATVTVFMAPPPHKEVNNTRPFYHENVTYYLTVINVGNVTYDSNLTVVDSLPEGVDYLRTIGVTGAVLLDGPVLSNNNKTITWVITNIPAYTTAVIIVEAQANAVGVKVNNETVVYPDGSSQTVNATIEVQPIVDVSVIKTVDRNVYFIGDVVVWTVKVANAFNGSAATDVKLYETLPGQFTLINYTATKGTYANDVWTIGTMANGTEETLTLYTRALTNGTFTNYVNVTCNETEWNYTNNYDNETVIVNKNPDINKTVNDTTPYTHEVVEYYLTVTNTGIVDYTNNLTVIDSLPEGLIYANEYKVDGAELLNFVVDGQKIYWTITNVSANSRAVITVKVLADKAGDLVNNGTLVPHYGNNVTVNCTITPIPRADLEIVKLVSQKISYYNDRVIWTIVVKNNGPDTAENAVVTDKLPSGIVYVSDDSNGAYNPKTGIWKLGDLPTGQSRTLKIVTVVKVTNRTIINSANVSSDTPDPNMTNNKAKNETDVPPMADLMIIKDVDKDKVKVGDKVEFTIVVINLGPDTAVNTRAYDVLPDGLKLISFKVSRGTYDPDTGIWTIGDMAEGDSASLSIVAEALITGEIVNEAYVESDTYDPNETNNYDNATVIVEKPDEPPVPPVPPVELYPTGNPIALILISLLSIVGISLKRKS